MRIPSQLSVVTVGVALASLFAYTQASPGPTAPAAALAAQDTGPNQTGPNQTGPNQTGLCHATGSLTNPFVFIRVNPNAADQHLAHGDFPASSPAACQQETATPTAATNTPTTTPTNTRIPPTNTSTTTPTNTPIPPTNTSTNTPTATGTRTPTNTAIPPTNTPVPCNTATNSGGPGTTTTTHNLGQTSGTFTFSYDAQTVPDKFDIYLGTGTSGTLLYSTNVPVSGANSVQVPYSGNANITVVVTGPTGTLWSYIVTCPTTATQQR
jgi:hypothetical protein